MTNNNVDLIVIGAGATGSSVAYEATRRGMKVVLIDAGDIGGGTSCRSTKLLHGGVRYLELAFKTLDLNQLKLVREALLERGHWLEQAPFLAKPIELALPAESYFAKAYFRLGLGLYDALSGNKSISSSRLLSSSILNDSIPQLRAFSSGGVAYSDGQFNDARLNCLLALTAKRAGAIIRTHCKVIGFEQANGKLIGVISQNQSGQQERWGAKSIVNATGVEADNIRSMVDESAAPRVLTSRGIHLVLKENLCPKNMGLLLPSTDDGRVLFLLPFFGQTLMGTTDSPCNIEDARKPSDTEETYLLEYLKRCFPQIKKPVITSSWAGGRPLLKPMGQSLTSSRVVREHEVETLPCGLISALGGKWTTCRPIAMDTLKAVALSLKEKLPEPQALPLIGASRNPYLTQKLLQEQKPKLKQYLPQTKLVEKQLTHLQGQYGLEAIKVIANSTDDQKEPLSEVIPVCKAELQNAIKNEYACTPTDVLARRCRLAMVDIQEAERLVPIVQEHLIKEGFAEEELDLER